MSATLVLLYAPAAFAWTTWGYVWTEDPVELRWSEPPAGVSAADYDAAWQETAAQVLEATCGHLDLRYTQVDAVDVDWNDGISVVVPFIPEDMSEPESPANVRITWGTESVHTWDGTKDNFTEADVGIATDRQFVPDADIAAGNCDGAWSLGALTTYITTIVAGLSDPCYDGRDCSEAEQAGTRTWDDTPCDLSGASLGSDDIEGLQALYLPYVAPSCEAVGDPLGVRCHLAYGPEETEYTWDMGDGTILSGTDVTHTYAAAGTYPMTLSWPSGCGEPGILTWEVVAVGPGTVEGDVPAPEEEAPPAGGCASAPVVVGPGLLLGLAGVAAARRRPFSSPPSVLSSR